MRASERETEDRERGEACVGVRCVMLGLVTSGQQCGILLSSKNGFDATGFYNSFIRTS